MNLLIVLSLFLAQDSIFPLADPAPAIAAAQKRAATENKRVLILWGTNDSEPARAAAAMLKKNRDVAKVILYEYEVVLAETRHSKPAKKSETNPWFDLLAADGKELASVPVPADGKAAVELLNKHKAEPLKALEVLAAAKKRAGEEKKRVLLTFGAPW